MTWLHCILLKAVALAVSLDVVVAMEPPQGVLGGLHLSAAPKYSKVRARYPPRDLLHTDREECNRRIREYHTVRRAQRKLEDLQMHLPESNEELLSLAHSVRYGRGVSANAQHEGDKASKAARARKRFAAQTQSDLSSFHVTEDRKHVTSLLEKSRMSKAEPHTFEGPLDQLGIDLRHGEVNRQGEMLHRIPNFPGLALKEHLEKTTGRRYSVVKAGEDAAVARLSYHRGRVKQREPGTVRDVARRESSTTGSLRHASDALGSPVKRGRIESDGASKTSQHAGPPPQRGLPFDLNEVPPADP